jgi:hypothetical protein
MWKIHTRVKRLNRVGALYIFIKPLHFCFPSTGSSIPNLIGVLQPVDKTPSGQIESGTMQTQFCDLPQAPQQNQQVDWIESRDYYTHASDYCLHGSNTSNASNNAHEQLSVVSGNLESS